MATEDLAPRVDHTALGPGTTPTDVLRTVDEARQHRMNACVPPGYVSLADRRAPDLTLVTVVDFPHGQGATETRCAAVERAVDDGADEVDVVIRIGQLLAGDRDAVRRDLEAVVATSTVPVKVIVETALLDDAAKRAAGELARDAGADYLKTCTGFAGGGATVADVELLAEFLPVKASGGVRTRAEAEALLDAGAERIGTSSGVALVTD